MNSFRIFTPIEQNVIHKVTFSADAKLLLIVGGNSQAKVYTREGKVVLETIKGDMYLKDMNQTMGHVAMTNDG